MGNAKSLSKFSKKNRLLIAVLLSSIAVVFAFLAVLLYINYYARVQVILTTIARYEDGTIKYVTEYDIINVKEGKTATTFPTPAVDGYNFGGWFLDDECTQPYDYSLVLDKSIQVFGKLELLNYSIELILDEGKKVTTNLTTAYDYTEKCTIEDVIRLPLISDTIKLDDGSEVNIEDYKQLHKEGYTFVGWGFSSTASTPVDNVFQMTPQNLTFYAIWRPIQVGLRYCSLDLSFAQRSPQSNFIESRIDPITGGVKYNTVYSVYVSETLAYGTKVRSIADPKDENKNFVFSGWYMDPNFTVPVKFSQLYIRNGYFSLNRENNINIIKDPLYFDSGEVVDDETYDNIMQYSSTDENASYISIFAKWELKKYTVKYHLNLPTSDSYIDTELMTNIVNYGVGRYVYQDAGNTLRQDSNVYQGKLLHSAEYSDSVLYDEGYFKNVVYIVDDMTGLPLYTLKGWNAYSDGSGYDAQNSSDKYFDKSNFEIINDTITIYAQWQSYHRVNYYLTGGGNNVLLATKNVESNKISLPTFTSLVDGVSNRVVTFTDKQKEINLKNGLDLTKAEYKTPSNMTFIGWTNESYYSVNNSMLYINGRTYSIGTNVDWKDGIYLNSAVRNLYTAWVGNTNYFSYDLEYNESDPYNKKEDLTKYSFETINGINRKTNIFEIEKTNNQETIIGYKHYLKNSQTSTNIITTITDSQFLVKKTEDGKLYSLYSWKLADGTEISGYSNEKIEFNDSYSLYRKFIENSTLYTYYDDATGREKCKYREIFTGVFIAGELDDKIDNQIIFENDEYLTRYSYAEKGSYIYLKAKSIMMLTFRAEWVENINITYDAGVDDANWNGNSEDVLNNTAGGSLYMTLSNPAGILTRPYYTFAGWSTVNREAVGEEVDYNTFIENNIIYQPDKNYELFREDTTLYAVWMPNIYTIQLYKNEGVSTNNSTIATAYLAKEKFTNGRITATDEVVLSGSKMSYKNINDEESVITLITSAIAGYGLSAWSYNKDGDELFKDGDSNYYSLQVGTNDYNNLFAPYETNLSISLYPKFSILNYDVKFILSGEGINSQNVITQYPNEEVVSEDIIYDTKVKSLVPEIYSNFYLAGYRHLGWLISGDIDNNGNIKDDYIISDIYTSSLSLRSNLTITLLAEEIKYPVKFVVRTPQGVETTSKSFEIVHGNSLTDGDINELKSFMDSQDFIGYDFSAWEIKLSGATRQLTYDDLKTAIVNLSLTFYSTYTTADVKVVYNYESGGQQKTKEIVGNKYLEIITIEDTFNPAPLKDGYILKGWSVNDTSDKYYVAGNSLEISSSVFGDNIYKLDDGTVVANIYAKWVEAVNLVFDTTGVSVTDSSGQAVALETLTYEIGTTVYFKDIVGLTGLSIVRTDNWGEYFGVWTDQKGAKYDISKNDCSITLNENITISPEFTARSYTFNFYYLYNSDYHMVSGLTMVVSEDYTVVPTLPTKTQVENQLSAISELSNHRATGYYLAKSETSADKIDINLGQEFDFVNKPEYFGKVAGKIFNFYIKLQELKTIIYYQDSNVEYRRLTLDVTTIHVIGDTDGDGVGEYTPSKIGYDFLYWTPRNGGAQYTNGQSSYVSALPNEFLPVWKVKDVKIQYYDSTTLLGEVASKFDGTVKLSSFNSSVEGQQLVGWAITDGGTKQFDVEQDFKFDDNASIVGSDLILQLYAVWEIETHVITIKSYDASGNETLKYVDASGNLVNNEVKINYATSVTINFPTTSNYVLNETTYEFTGKWSDGLNDYSTSHEFTVKKDYNFTPVYKVTYKLKFVDTDGNEIYSVDTSDSSFSFSNASLVNAVNVINAQLIPNGSKIIGFTYDGTTYTIGTSDAISISHNIVFEAVVSEFATVVIYKNIDTSYNFTGATTLSEFVIGSSVNLNNYGTTSSNSTTEGFVLSDNPNYTYNKDVTTLKTGTIVINTTKGSTVYLYPVIKVQVSYYLNGVIDNTLTENVRLGNVPNNYDVVLPDASEYMTGWRINSITGAEYSGEPITQSIKLYTLAKPFLQVQLVESDNYIANGAKLLINKLKESSEFALPNKSDITLKATYDGKFDVVGWYLSYNSQYVKVGSANKVYALGQTITLGDVINELGVSVEGTIYFEMTPIYVATITMFNSDKITYNYSAQLTEELNSYESQFTSNNKFNLLLSSLITANTNSLTFTSYLLNAGQIVTKNSVPVSAIVTIAKAVDSGYSSDGWYYCSNSGVVSSRNVVSGAITQNENIIAQTAQPNELKVTVKLKYFDGSSYSIINNTSAYKDIVYLDTEGNYASEYTVTTGSSVTYRVVVDNGYEVVGTGYTLNGNVYTYTHTITSATDIEITIKKSEVFKPIINIDVSNISSYDASKLSASSKVYVEHIVDGSWERLYKSSTDSVGEVVMSDFSGNSYQYGQAIAVNSDIRVVTNFISDYYYVDKIIVYIDGTANEFRTNAMSGSAKVSMTGIPVIDIVLKDRTFEIACYDGGSQVSISTATAVKANIEVELPSLTKDNYTLQGFKISSGTGRLNTSFVRYIKASEFTTENVFNFTLSQLVSNSNNVNYNNQKVYILVEPVWTTNQYALTLSSDKGYFLVNGNNVGNSATFNVAYGDQLTFTKSISGGVIATNSLDFVTKSYTVDNSGNVSITSTNQKVVFVTSGTWEFVDGYGYGSSQLLTDSLTMTGQLALTPNTEAGDGVIGFSITDNITGVNNNNLSVGVVKFTKNAVETTSNIVYNTSGALNGLTFNFSSEDDCVIAVSLSNGYQFVSFTITGGGSSIVIDNSLTSDALDAFVTATGIDLSYNLINNSITFNNLTKEINVALNVSRANYTASVKVNSDESLNSYYNDIVNNGGTLLQVNSTNINLNSTSIDTQALRKVKTYSLTPNSNYFRISRISYIDGTQEFVIFGEGKDVNTLSTYDALSNTLTIVHGGLSGNDLEFVVELQLRSFNIIFHDVNGASYTASSVAPSMTTSNISYGTEISSVSLNTPSSATYNGQPHNNLTLNFTGWTFYNGNYENGTIDNSKFVDITNFSSWTFNAINGNLHIFSNWEKEYAVNFGINNDGYSANQVLPSNMTRLTASSAITLSPASREGFTFAGYTFSVNSVNYTINYNGANFTTLESSEYTSNINSNSFNLSAILTSDMISLSTTFKTFELVPIWTRNTVGLTINNDTSKGSVKFYTYSSGTFTEAATLFTIEAYNVIEASTILLSGKTYNCLYIKDNGVIKGAVVILPNTANYYKFGEFQVNGSKLSSLTLTEAKTIDVVYAGDYVPHTINFNWDASYGDVSYELTNTGAKQIKVVGNIDGEIDTMTVNAGQTIQLTKTYTSIVVNGIRDTAISVEINFNGYYYDEVNKYTSIEFSVESSSNTASATTSYTMKLDTVSVALSQYLYDTKAKLTTGQSYNISYYSPVVDSTSGLISSYEVVSINTSDIDYVISDLAYGTRVYVSSSNNEYQIVDINNGESLAQGSEGNLYFVANGDMGVNVIFDYSYAQVNFSINNQNYANGYFATTNFDIASTNKPTPNSDLVAFARLIVYGGSISNNIVKSVSGAGASYVKTYYTASELNNYQFAINENLAKMYYNDENYANIWVDGFNFNEAYTGNNFGSPVTIDDLFVSSGVATVSFIASVSQAKVLTLQANYNTIDSAVACGGFTMGTGDYIILGNSVLNEDTRLTGDVYSTLSIKVRVADVANGETEVDLPSINVVCDKHTYVEGDALNEFNSIFTDFDWSKLSSGADGLNYSYSLDFNVKQLVIKLITSDGTDTTYEFEKDYSSSSSVGTVIMMSITYATTNDEILANYGLNTEIASKIKNGSDETLTNFEFSEFRSQNGNSISDFNTYLTSLTSYSNNSTITIYAIYDKVSE